MSGGRELKTFPLNPSVLGKLTNAGFIYANDLASLKPSQLSTEVNISLSEAIDVLKTLFEDANMQVWTPTVPASKTALQMLQEEQEMGGIVTFSENLDDMLGGGVPLCKLTELCGIPGTGKTQLCLQLAVDAHIPDSLGGLVGEVVYIDTQGGFVVERMIDVATATVKHCQLMGNQETESNLDLANFTVEKILAGTYFYRCQDHIELIATIHLLPKFLEQHKRVKLVIVDSIASPFRLNFDDMSARTRLLTTLAQNLTKIAVQFKVAVVLTNQMTTKIVPGGGNSHLIPALGESWGHVSNIRIILFWENNQRKALLSKSPSKPESTCSFQITTGGIRDVIQEPSTTDSGLQTSLVATSSATVNKSGLESTAIDTDDFHADPPSKRQRVT